MKLTAKVKLLSTDEQHRLLLRTMEVANAACNHISEVAWNERTFNKYGIQKLVYQDVRDMFDLAAQMTIRCIAKVADSYKIDRKTQRTFREHGAIVYDSRILSWKLDKSEVSIWMVDGRLKIPFVCGDRHRELLKTQRGESDLCLVDGTFYLFTTCDVDTLDPSDVDEFLGVDMGVKNIATDSDGNTYSGAHVNALRKRHAKLRKKLQSKGTKSARRLLTQRRRKEKRFAKDVNHCIAKELVERAQGTGRGIALEDLSGIRGRVTVRKAQRRQHHSWSFHDLRLKIEYKAELAGVPVVSIDPRNTSRTCHACGCIDKASRNSQSEFLCTLCGFAVNADYNAAVNIGRRAAVNQPNVSDASSSALM